MTKFDITKVQSSSLTPGLQDLGPISDAVLVFNGTIPIHGSLSATIPLNFPTNNVISVIKINVQGGHAGALWFPVGPVTVINETTSGGYLITANVQSSATGRQINLQFINETVGATVTLPTLTITAHTHLYSYAW